MMKAFFFAVMITTTAIRLASLIIVLSGGNTALPAITLVLSSASIIFGALLIVRRYVFSIRFRHFIQFFSIQTMIFGINLTVVSNTVILHLSFWEILLTGTLLDIIIGVGIIYYSGAALRGKKQSRLKK